MDLREFIELRLERVKQVTERTMNDLTPDELKWQPKPEGNPIGLIYFHMARAEDRFVQEFIQGKPRIWETDKWYEKLNMSEDDAGGMGYTAEQVAAFVVPELKDLQAFAEAVRSKSMEYLKDMTPDKFDEVITLPRFGEVSVGSVWTIIVNHLTQHTGEIGYLRGLQRGINK